MRGCRADKHEKFNYLIPHRTLRQKYFHGTNFIDLLFIRHTYHANFTYYLELDVEYDTVQEGTERNYCNIKPGKITFLTKTKRRAQIIKKYMDRTRTDMYGMINVQKGIRSWPREFFAPVFG